MSAKVNYYPAFDANGNKAWKVTGWEGVKKKSCLPAEYLNGDENRFYEKQETFGTRQTLFVRSPDENIDPMSSMTTSVILLPGTLVTPEQRAAIKRTMDRAKERLSAILKKQRKSEWSGMVSVIVNECGYWAELTCEKVWDGGEKRYKVVGWSGVPDRKFPYQCGSVSTGAKWSMNWGKDYPIGVAPLVFELTPPLNQQRGEMYWHPDDLVRPIIYDLCAAEFMKELTRQFKAMGEPGQPVNRIDFTLVVAPLTLDPSVTVTVGKYSATMLWAKEGDGYRFWGAKGDGFVSQSNRTHQHYPRPGDWCFSLYDNETTVIPRGCYATPNQYQELCALYRIRLSHTLKDLAANEKYAEDREREEWLAQGTQIDEV